MRVLPADRYRRMPWKNGGGETTEIAVFPADAALDDFDWRISMAHVASDGEFSSFEGVDRTLSVLTGEGVTLHVEGRQPALLGPDSEPYSFPGDLAVHSQLRGGPVTDLNVMTRRGRFAHSVHRRAVEDEILVGAAGAVTLAIADSSCVAGGSRVIAPFESILLEAGETASLRPSRGMAILFTIELIRIGSAD